jgi:simple sugar transport system permease protein
LGTSSVDAFARIDAATERLRRRREFSVLVGLAAIWAIGLFMAPGEFLELNRFNRMFRSAARTAVVGYGVALLMITAEFDLSVGSLMALSGGMALFMISEVGIASPFAAVLILAFAFLYGISQGLMVTKLGLPSLIVTIGTLTLLRGALRILTGGVTIGADSDLTGVFQLFGAEVELGIDYMLPFVHSETHTWNSISVQILWMVVLLGVFHYVLFHTRFGYHVRATGDNVESVETTGIDPEMIKIGCFGVASLMSAVGAMMLVGRSPSVSSATGSGFELLVIAAVVLGGTKLTGGQGSMIGVLLGALVLSSANTVLNLANLGLSGWQGVITGAFIIAAIGLDAVFRVVTLDALRTVYVTPTRELLGSPSEFFRVKAGRKTTDHLFAYLVVTILVTGVSLLVVDGLLNVEAVGSTIGIDTSNFQIFLEGGFVGAIIQVYFFVFLLAVLAFFAIQVVDSDGDYEHTIAVITYGLFPAPLLTVPVMLYGYDLIVVGGTLTTGLLALVPVLLVFLALMYLGITGTRELSARNALAAVGAVGVAWAVVLGYVSLTVLAVG